MSKKKIIATTIQLIIEYRARCSGMESHLKERYTRTWSKNDHEIGHCDGLELQKQTEIDQTKHGGKEINALNILRSRK